MLKKPSSASHRNRHACQCLHPSLPSLLGLRPGIPLSRLFSYVLHRTRVSPLPGFPAREAADNGHEDGDDALQKRLQGYVEPDSFTHGTSEERKRWFLKGFEGGKVTDGNPLTGTRP